MQVVSTSARTGAGLRELEEALLLQVMVVEHEEICSQRVMPQPL